jgi:hypothetical protein
VVVLLVIVLAAAAVWFVTDSLGNNVERVPNAFAGVEESTRPAAESGTTFLL